MGRFLKKCFFYLTLYNAGIFHVALATRFHLRPQYLQIHPSAFDILHRSDFEGMPSQRIRISVVISTPGITRNRNRSVAVEKDAMFAHFSLPCRPSRYARTSATVASVSALKPSSSCMNCFSTMEMKVFILPKLILTPSNPGQAVREG